MLEQLKKRLFWKPRLREFLAPMRSANSFEIGIERLTKGIDNTRVDVLLSPKFTSHLRLWMQQELTEYSTGRQATARGVESDLEILKDAYSAMMVAAIDQEKKSSRPGLIALLQFSVIKFQLQVINDEIDRLQAQMQKSREETKHHANVRAVEIHERLVSFSKDDFAYRYQICRKFFREMQKLEELNLCKLRRSALEIDWPVPRGVLFNPLLHIPSMWADEQWMAHYPLTFTDRQDPQMFERVNRLLMEVLHDYLPTYAWPVDDATSDEVADPGNGRNGGAREHQDREVLAGLREVSELLKGSLQPEEYEQHHLCWIDIPENLDDFFNSAEPRRWRRVASGKTEIVRLWPNDFWPDFHNRMLKKIFQGLNQQGLGDKIIASYSAPLLYQELGGRLPVRLIYGYLANMLPRRTLVRRLRTLQPAINIEETMRLLDGATVNGERLSTAYRHRQMLNFLVDFAVLRRDLKNAYRAHQIMNGIRVLTRAADIELSRDNATLNVFVLAEEQKPDRNRIRCHAVLKADVRGSTEMIRELRKRKLNPAFHFSGNFFQPINELLSIYGAKKIFVEGDAVILSLFEYQEQKYQWPCVALACGLAGMILKVVDARNQESRKNSLPELELGLGIAFLDEAPTFLLDENREIMISPAINRADQLSSCSVMLRKSEFGKDLGRGVEVVAASVQPLLDKESGDRMMRYNVNGIELDTPAFIKLQSELALSLVRMDEQIYPGGARFYVGRYADVRGKSHWLVVREAPIRVWKGGGAGEGEQYGHRFYQVVTDADVITRILAKLNQPKARTPDGDAGQADELTAKEMHYEP